jgi:hypothetical protein
MCQQQTKPYFALAGSVESDLLNHFKLGAMNLAKIQKRSKQFAEYSYRTFFLFLPFHTSKSLKISLMNFLPILAAPFKLWSIWKTLQKGEIESKFE